jgi:hypothetical protein
MSHINTLADAFKQATFYNKARYVVLWDYQNLPMRVSDVDPIEILVADKNAFVECLGLHKLKGKNYKLCNAEGNQIAEFLIHEKAHNFLPDRFEAEMLSRAWCNTNGISVPDQEHAILLILWRNLYIYRNIESVYEKLTIAEYLNQRVGTKFPEKN